ncbi:MAG: AbrB/MazE/SpoVT family DNA-binding domain-containing protein [Hadesarchaea archaeon]|nr:AbrB/MazE/SpoVT family DNA-binding domain-containing protein [Hadesarchaea archaeon]
MNSMRVLLPAPLNAHPSATLNILETKIKNDEMKTRYTITKRRQVTLPAAALKAIGVGPGDSITYDIEKDRITITKHKEVAQTSEVINALEGLAEELRELKPYIIKAGEALTKGLAEQAPS